MAAIESLESSVQQCPQSLQTKYQIIKSFWDIQISFSEFENGRLHCDKYFLYYAEQCRLALHDDGRHVWIRTHRDVIEITALLKEPTTRNDLRERIRKKLPGPPPDDAEDIIDNTIDLGVRLLLMTNVGCFKYGFNVTSQLSWTDGSLSGFAHQRFIPCQTLKGITIKLEKMFNARNLERVAGIQISWTDSLADHLSMRDDDTRVAIFHHASFLEYQRESLNYPPGFVDETIRTLALLFPQYEKASTVWYRKLSPVLSLDMQATRCGHLKASDRYIENYTFWHDRLVILKQVFDEAEPGSISEWWYDRRKGVQWYTFWLAVIILVLTILFGAVQCVEGGLQAYKAYYPS